MHDHHVTIVRINTISISRDFYSLTLNSGIQGHAYPRRQQYLLSSADNSPFAGGFYGSCNLFSQIKHFDTRESEKVA